MNRNFALLLIATSLTFVACKKNKVSPDPVGPTTENPSDEVPPATTNRLELSQDSVFLYAKQLYYWNTLLPTYKAFNPRSYVSGSTDMDKYDGELLAIAKYSSNKYDIYKNADGSYANETKFSYISDITAQNPTGSIREETASVDLEGNGNDIGIRFVPYLTSNTTNAYLLFVTAVYPGSPAALAGVKRGMVVTKLNGTAIGANYNNERSTLNTQLAANVVSIEGRNYLTNATFSYTLTKVPYKSSPVYAQKVFTAGTKKIGYLAFARFSRLSSPKSSALADEDLDPVFTNFANAGVTDLIIDLRYNGGGYIQTAEYLINLMAQPANTGKVMFAEHYNATMQDNKAVILKNQPLPDDNNKVQYSGGKIVTYFDYIVNPYSVENNTAKFNKKGTLNNVQNIVFLVTENTASASELVINSLRPYANVKVVGSKTYGKPIGFFPVVIENRYKLYLSMFETKNAAGNGGYYDGILPDAGYDENLDATGKLWDNVMYDFGDVKESYLAAAIDILAPGQTATTSAVRIMSIGGKTITLSSMKSLKPLKDAGFVGMIEDKSLRRK